MIVPPLLEYTHLLFIVAQSPHWLRLYCTAWIKPTCRVYFLRTQRVLSPNSSMDQNDDLHSMVPRGYIHQVAAGKHQKHRKLMGGWEYQKSFHCFFGKILHATSMFFFPLSMAKPMILQICRQAQGTSAERTSLRYGRWDKMWRCRGVGETSPHHWGTAWISYGRHSQGEGRYPKMGSLIFFRGFKIIMIFPGCL